MRLVIVESPYAGNVTKHVAYAKQAVLDCLLRGEAPIASHLLFTREGLLNDNNPSHRKLGIAAGLAWHHVADAIIVYTDNGISPGMLAAIDSANRYKIPIEYRQLSDS